MRGLPAEILMAPVPAWGFTERDWWRSEDGLVAYLGELAKLVVYLAGGL